MLAAVEQRKPIILVRETDDAHGADTFASLRKRRYVSSTPFTAVHSSVKVCSRHELPRPSMPFD